MRNIEAGQRPTLKDIMYQGNRAMARVFLVGGIAMTAVGGAGTIGVIASESQRLAPHEESLTQAEIDKLNSQIVADEISIALLSLMTVGSAVSFGYLYHGYNENANLFKPSKKPEEDKS